jgi:hypothetical protein
LGSKELITSNSLPDILHIDYAELSPNLLVKYLFALYAEAFNCVLFLTIICNNPFAYLINASKENIFDCLYHHL